MQVGHRLLKVAGAAAVLTAGLLVSGCLYPFSGDAKDGKLCKNIEAFVAQSTVPGDPRIKPDISLRISIIAGGKSEDYTQQVSPAGELAMPLVGAIKCNGLTVVELQDKLKTAYSQYLHDPQVTVQLLYTPGMVSPWGSVQVGGAVGHPCKVDLPQTHDLTVTRALQNAGGTTAVADLTAVMITRKLPNGEKIRLKLDLNEIAKKGDPERDVVLQADDSIFVPEIFW